VSSTVLPALTVKSHVQTINASYRVSSVKSLACIPNVCATTACLIHPISLDRQRQGKSMLSLTMPR
jgi:hypothetical protein